mgnify:CR=1 FL=1
METRRNGREDAGSTRLFLSENEAPALRRKLKHPDCRLAWGRLLAACEELLKPDPAPLYPRHIRASHLAFAYRLTGRREFADKAREMVLARARDAEWEAGGRHRMEWRAGLATGGALCELALTYDWLRDQWSRAERAEVRRAVLEKGLEPACDDIRKGARCAEWYTCNGMCVVNGPALMAAILFEDEMDTSEAFERSLLQVRRAIAAHCPDGGYPEGLGYWNYGIRHLLLGVEALRRLKGIDLYEEPFLRNTGDYALHFILPWPAECTNTADSRGLTRLWPPVAALAARHRRPEWQWLARRLLTRDWGMDGEALEYSLFYLIYYDPEVPSHPPAPSQTACLFSGLQQLSLRSDWTDDAIHVVWLNGPSNCHHNHLHLNHVSVNAYGERLLIDMGQYDYAKDWEYRKQTAGHNSLLVDGEGQIITTDEAIFCRRIRAGEWGTVFGEFRCLREEAGATIATGSVVNAYAGRLRRFDRTLAFVERRFLFLHDSIELEKEPPADLEWHFHAGGALRLARDRVVFAAGRARLAMRLLCAQPVERSEAVAPPELDRPDKPVPRLDLKAVCRARTFDLFALLVPFRQGTEPRAALRFKGDGVQFEMGARRWTYNPASRGLARRERAS